ncbi:MAG: hypothetical protein AB9891_06260 [Anaerolineaceae bacterium]
MGLACAISGNVFACPNEIFWVFGKLLWEPGRVPIAYTEQTDFFPLNVVNDLNKSGFYFARRQVLAHIFFIKSVPNFLRAFFFEPFPDNVGDSEGLLCIDPFKPPR